MPFYELRQYEIRPGKMAAWLTLFEDEIIPFQVARGMVVAGSFHGEEDDSVFIWLRRFESEEEREKLYEAVYQDAHWKEVISPKVGELINREAIKVQRIKPSSRSVLR